MRNKRVFLGWIPKTWVMYAAFKRSPHIQWDQAKNLQVLFIPFITNKKPAFIDKRSRRRVKVKVTIEEIE